VTIALGRSGRALGLLAGALGAGCAGAQQPAADSVVGCYQLVQDAGARALGLPWGFVLEQAALEPGWLVSASLPDARRALTATSPTGRQDFPFGYWAWTGVQRDSIEVGYPGGGGGFVLRLAPSGQDLVGLGRAVGDAVAPGQPSGPRPPSPVAARRVLCGAS
jgi:hypothetical protein